MPVKELKLSQIRTDGGTQSREKLDKEAVDEYAEKLQDGEEFPEVQVIQDGDNYWLWDGFHRLEAHRKAGLGVIRAKVEPGTLRDAILKSVGANDKHGVKRTDADKRYAVKLLLNDPEWVAKSNRWIAKAANVGNKFVGSVREQLCPDTPETTTGQDGKQYPAKRKTKLGKLREQFPNLSEAHLRAAQGWEDAEEYLEWADQCDATVKEMEAYRRIQRGEPSPDPTPPLPTTVSTQAESDASKEENEQEEEEEINWNRKSFEIAQQIRVLFSGWPQGPRILIEQTLHALSQEDHSKWSQAEIDSETEEEEEEIDWNSKCFEATDHIRKYFSKWPVDARFLIEQLLHMLSKEDHEQW